MRFRVTRTARRHRIGNGHILAAIRDAGVPTVVQGLRGPQLHYIGVDDRGVQLHVVAIEDNRREGWLAIIHAMPTHYTDTTTNTEPADADTEPDTELDADADVDTLSTATGTGRAGVDRHDLPDMPTRDGDRS